MKWSMASTGLVAAGLVGIVIIILFQNITVNNEEDYYLLKEISQAAMIDAIDLAHFRDYGRVKIIQEKYVESFTRRFAEAANVTNTSNYLLGFYNIMEYPPKASVSIGTNLGEYTVFGNHLTPHEYSISNSLDSIIEVDEIDNKKEDCDEKKTYYSIPYISQSSNVKSTSNSAKIKPPETEDDTVEWQATDIIPIGKVQMVSHIMVYYETFSDMYDEVINPWSISDPNAADYIASKMTLKSLSLSDSSGNTVVSWSADVLCDKGSADLKTYGGHAFANPVCPYGIIYEVNWHNNACDE